MSRDESPLSAKGNRGASPLAAEQRPLTETEKSRGNKSISETVVGSSSPPRFPTIPDFLRMPTLGTEAVRHGEPTIFTTTEPMFFERRFADPFLGDTARSNPVAGSFMAKGGEWFGGERDNSLYGRLLAMEKSGQGNQDPPAGSLSPYGAGGRVRTAGVLGEPSYGPYPEAQQAPRWEYQRHLPPAWDPLEVIRPVLRKRKRPQRGKGKPEARTTSKDGNHVLPKNDTPSVVPPSSGEPVSPVRRDPKKAVSSSETKDPPRGGGGRKRERAPQKREKTTRVTRRHSRGGVNSRLRRKLARQAAREARAFLSVVPAILPHPENAGPGTALSLGDSPALTGLTVMLLATRLYVAGGLKAIVAWLTAGMSQLTAALRQKLADRKVRARFYVKRRLRARLKRSVPRNSRLMT